MAAIDFVIKGAVVYDGTGAPGRLADVAVSGEKIAALGEIGESDGVVIDATGLAVAPGFIDPHTHSDLPSLLAPLAESRLYAGVTSEIGGNCGFAAGPFLDADAHEFLHHYESLEITWRSQGEFFDRLEVAGSAVNHAFLAGHGNIRRVAMGGDFDRGATPDEIRRMRAILSSEIEAGAIGMSTGLIYPPGCFAAKEEIADLARVLADGPLVYATHMRSEGPQLMESLDEALFIAETAGAPLHVSHLKVHEREHWHKIDQLRQWWASRDARSVRITADRYPYTASHTLLDTILPQWAFEGGGKAELTRLSSEEKWARIREEMLEVCTEEGFWDSIMISSVAARENKGWEGRKLTDIAAEMGARPVDAARRMLLADKARTMAVFFRMSEANMLEICSWEDVLVGSDSAVRAATGQTAKGFPHPRACGTTGRALRLLVREQGVLSLPEAINRMTGRVAEVFGLKSRGLLCEGYAADIVVFDADGISDAATYEKPCAFTKGVRHLFVNGRPVLSDGRVTGEKPGKVLRHGG